MSGFFYREKFLKPEIFLSDVLRKSAQGRFFEKDENVRVFYRALVIAVDVVGGQLENADGSGKTTHVIDGKNVDVSATVGPENPKNSIKARVLTAGFDQFRRDDDVRTFWPFFPEHASVPIKPGEHVYVLFEDEGFQHGLWFAKVSGHENANMFKGESSYGRSDGKSLSELFQDTSGYPSSSRDVNTDAAASEVLVNGEQLLELFSF